MAQERVQKEKQTSKQETEEVTEVEPQDLKNAELEEDVADILDEIDDVLEENAQEFVADFIQKGGQ